MSESLGTTEAVSIALGGMIGGGIYAVLGVVVGLAGAATWLGFVLAGTVAGGAAYAYYVLNRLTSQRSGGRNGGSVTFVQFAVGNSTLAGMVGWTLLVGYLGSIAMYAVAFGAFAVRLGLPPATLGLPTRPLISVLTVAGFVGLNLVGARATGQAENVLVAAKVGVLVAFGVAGVAFVTAGSPQPLRMGRGGLLATGPLVAAAVSFVAFQGWQLLFYDQESIADPVATIGRAVAVAIPVAVCIYVLVVVATFNLAPQALAAQPHTALSDAGATVAGALGFARLGAVVISLSALISTGSAINATLFSTGYLAKGMLDDGLLPDRVGEASGEGIPSRTLVLVGGATAALAAFGSLGAVTAFASLSFIVVFGAVSYLALRHREEADAHPLPPAVGLVGTLTFLPLMFWHLWTAQRGTFVAVVGLTAIIITAELAYFERDVLAETVVTVEREIEQVAGAGDSD